MAVQMTCLRCQHYKVQWFYVDVLSAYYFIGVEDQLQPFDADLQATRMLNESRLSPTFYPDDFKVSAGIILQSALGLTQQQLPQCLFNFSINSDMHSN